MGKRKTQQRLASNKVLTRPSIKFRKLTHRDRLCLNCLNVQHMAHSLATTPEVVQFWKERFGLPALNILGSEYFDVRAVREWAEKVDIRRLCELTPPDLLPKQITVLPNNSLKLPPGQYWLIPVQGEQDKTGVMDNG